MFHIGQKVVRVPVENPESYGDAALRGKTTMGKPVIGCVYTIRAINEWPHATILRFAEFDYSHLIGINGSTIEPGWNSRGFRPVVERKTDISIFTEILNKQPSLTDA